MVPDGVKIVYLQDGRHSGKAFVMFSTQAEAKRALKMDGERIGSRYIELFLSTVKEMLSADNFESYNKSYI